jgi:two-component system, NarL family, response regulator DesR
MSVRVVLVEDQKMMLAALGALIETHEGVSVVGAFHDPRAALEGVRSLKPDVVVADIQMPGLSGLELARALRTEGHACRVVLLSTFARAGYVEQAMKIGVHGYLLKEAAPERLIEVIKAAAAGRRQIDAALLELASEGRDPLSERDRVLLGFVRDGYSNADIADVLGLTEGTVKNLMSVILSSMGAKNRVEAFRLAERRGWI